MVIVVYNKLDYSITPNRYSMRTAVKTTHAITEALGEDAPKKPVNYTIKAKLHFDDGTNAGNVKVKALDAKEAESLAREQLKKRWDKPEGTLKKLEILSVKKG